MFFNDTCREEFFGLDISSKLWMLKFDGSCSSSCFGAKVVLISPNGQK